MQRPAGLAGEPLAQALGLATYGGEIPMPWRHERAHQQAAQSPAEFVLLLRLLCFSDMSGSTAEQGYAHDLSSLSWIVSR
ncbi:hypothetical protein D3C81_1981510 [compost metagenome]